MKSSKCNVQVLSSVKSTKSVIKIFYSFLIICLLLVANSNIQAQNLKDKKEVLAQLDTKKADKLNSLLNDIQPTIYLENGEMKAFGDGVPVYLKTDAFSINKLNEKNSKFNSVEILEIYLTVEGQETKIFITPELVSGLSNLKYILIRSEYHMKSEKFEKILSGFSNSNIVLIYEVSIPR